MSDEELKRLDRYIQLVRTGSFTEVIQNPDVVPDLSRWSTFQDFRGAQSTAILIESLDQVGRFRSARKFANADVGMLQLRALEQELKKAKPSHEIVRAHAWLLLQCAVSEFRTGGAQKGLSLLRRGIELIFVKRGDASKSQHIQSLYHFWRARMLSNGAYEFREADKEFDKALEVARRTFDEKLAQLEQDNPPDAEEKRGNHAAAAAYVLSTILGFGLAQARQLESRLSDSLWLLRAAVLLSLGTKDVHRRGFVHLLMGTTLRGLARKDSHELRDAEKHLRIARELLERKPAHSLHLARVHHQMSLVLYTGVGPGVAKAEAERQILRKALKLNKKAWERSNQHECKEFRDPLLDYGMKVVRSLINIGLGDFPEAYADAESAAKSLESGAPKGTRGWAVLAQGMALAEAVTSENDQEGLLKAERALLRVAEDMELRPTDRAAAQLHLARLYARVDQRFKAAHHVNAVSDVVDQAEHGWLKDLFSLAKSGLGEVGPELRLNLEEELRKFKEQNNNDQHFWKYITGELETEAKRRLLALEDHQRLLREKDGEAKLAKALGVTRATVFTWKNDKKLSELFPKRPSRK